VTVVGRAAAISAGERIKASGEWVNDRTHGQQFRAQFLKTSAPTSIEGIQKYLGSRMIRGCPAYAKKLVRASIARGGRGRLARWVTHRRPRPSQSLAAEARLQARAH
jgi:hypothetical protein